MEYQYSHLTAQGCHQGAAHRSKVLSVYTQTRRRVEVGFGTGYQQYEFQRFGINLAENRAMFEEGLDLLTQLLSTENVRHQGRYWNLPETTTLPRPLTKPHPQFWRATSSVPTMAWSLARGIKVITGGTASSMERVINHWHLFQDAVEAANVHWPQEFILQRGVYVSDTEARTPKPCSPMPSGTHARPVAFPRMPCPATPAVP